MLAAVRGLSALRSVSAAAVRYKSSSPRSTGVSPLVHKFDPSPRWQAVAEAVSPSEAPVRVLPPVIPQFLRQKLVGARVPGARPRNIPNNIKRKRREQALLRPLEELPSGPRAFHVDRSRMGNFPIYTDVRNGGSKVVTILRKFRGDVKALALELQSVTGKEVTAYHGRMEVRGRHAPVIAEWLGKLGF
eukprot:scaffold89676_cov44-Tisochrysis_lutea.AAC.1